MSDSQETTAWLRAMPVVFVLIWSTGFIVARYGMPYAPPFSFLLVRYICSILCFLPWILLARVAWPRDRAQWLHLSVTGILMHAGYLGGVWAAVKSGMGSGLSALIVGIQPVLTAIWLSWSLRGSDQPGVSPRQWGGLLLGFAGLLMVVWHKLTMGSALDHVTPVNMAFAIGALFSITVGTLYQKRFVQPCDVRSANTVQLLAAAVVEPAAGRGHGLVGVGPHAGRQFAAVHPDFTRRCRIGHQPDVHGAAHHCHHGLGALW
jgi:drug/metabolite transporter (DMT)-like permease